MQCGVIQVYDRGLYKVRSRGRSSPRGAAMRAVQLSAPRLPRHSHPPPPLPPALAPTRPPAGARLQMPERVPVESGVLDRRLGISSKQAACQTCGQKLAECAGHFGYIRLELPVFHIGCAPRLARAALPAGAVCVCGGRAVCACRGGGCIARRRRWLRGRLRACMLAAPTPPCARLNDDTHQNITTVFLVATAVQRPLAK